MARGYQIHIVDMGAKFSTHFPGGHILINRTLFEEFSGPEVAAGFILMERALAQETPPLSLFFNSLGTRATLGFLANGKLNDAALADFAENRLTGPIHRPDDHRLLALFAAAELTPGPVRPRARQQPGHNPRAGRRRPGECRLSAKAPGRRLDRAAVNLW